MKTKLINQDFLRRIEAEDRRGRSLLEAVGTLVTPSQELDCLSPSDARRYLGQRQKLDRSRVHEVELQDFALR